jgi:uncharacterized protein (DUF2236 family)
VYAERAVLLGWPRAILMQIAHPLIAAAVAEHSTFRRGPLGAPRRLHETVTAMLDITFGDEGERHAALAGIARIHRRVHGHLSERVGRFEPGTPYSAEDPDLLLWVHATLIESVALVYERLVAPLTPAERDAYCEESAPVALVLGAREAEVPRTWEALQAYLQRVLASDVLAVGTQARELAGTILVPPLALLTGPMGWASRLITIGLLPDQVRTKYGWDWDRTDGRRLRRVLSMLKRVRRRLPRRVARWSKSGPGGRLPQRSR